MPVPLLHRPQPETWPDAKSEEEFTFVFATIKAIRSLRSEYLQPKVEGTGTRPPDV